jgi:Sulfotransferase family
MTVHLIHIGKCGGTALRFAVRQAQSETGGQIESAWGPLSAQPGHKLTLADVPDGDKAVLAFRDPVSRFVSGFYSRLRKGRPRHFHEWSYGERKAFGWFTTPEELADALGDGFRQRGRAKFAMRSIFHLRLPMTQWAGQPVFFRENLEKVLYVARQETLDDDWERLKELLDIPRHVLLPHDDRGAHRTSYPRDTAIGDRGREAIARWYAQDYELIEIADGLREGRFGPSTVPPSD